MNEKTFGLSTTPISSLTKDNIIHEISTNYSHITEEQYQSLYSENYDETAKAIIEILFMPILTDPIKLGLLPSLSKNNISSFGKILNDTINISNRDRIINNLILIINRKLDINIVGLFSYDRLIEGLIRKSDAIDTRIRFYIQLLQNEYAIRYIIKVLLPKMFKEIEGYKFNTIINIINADKTYQISNIITNLVKGDIFILFEGLRTNIVSPDKYLTFYKMLNQLARQTIVFNLDTPEKIKLFSSLKLTINNKNVDYNVALEIFNNLEWSRLTNSEFYDTNFTQNLIVIFNDINDNKKKDLLSPSLSQYLEAFLSGIISLDNSYAEYFIEKSDNSEIEAMFKNVTETTKNDLLAKLSSTLSNRVLSITGNNSGNEVVSSSESLTSEDESSTPNVAEDLNQSPNSNEEQNTQEEPEKLEEETEELEEEPVEESSEESSPIQSEIDELFESETLDKDKLIAAIKDPQKLDIIIEKLRYRENANKLMDTIATLNEEDQELVATILIPKLPPTSEESSGESEIDEMFESETLDKDKLIAAIKDPQKLDLIIEKVRYRENANKLMDTVASLNEEEQELVASILIPKLPPTPDEEQE